MRLATSVSHQVWALVALITVTSILIWLFVGHYTRREYVSGSFVPQAGLLTITARNAGTVTTIDVAEGAEVQAGVIAASRPNRACALGALKSILAGCLLGLRPSLRDLRAALDVIVRTRCRIQTGRSYPRPLRTKPHVYTAYRAVC